MNKPNQSIGKILLAASAVFLLAQGSAFALEVAELKQQGIACEDKDGFLRVLKHSPEVDEFVKGKNSERKAKYDEIDQKTGAKSGSTALITYEKVDHHCP